MNINEVRLKTSILDVAKASKDVTSHP